MTEYYESTELPGHELESGLQSVAGDEGRFSKEATKDLVTRLREFDRARTVAAAVSQTMIIGAVELTK
jgi:hypothetical protein